MSKNIVLLKQLTTPKSEPTEVVSTEPNTPMLNQRPPKEETFVLQDFWPVLKIYQYVGLFPCKKVTNENGTVQLQPMKLWISIMAAFIWFLIAVIPQAGTVHRGAFCQFPFR